MRTAALLALLASTATAAWLSDEYWTAIHRGQPTEGRSEADFLRINGGYSDRNVRSWGWIAYLIADSQLSGGFRYEAFGHAIRRDDGQLCGFFPGVEEVLTVCDGFRILSRSKNRTQGEPRFEWVLASSASGTDTVGYMKHRIARTVVEGETIFGDSDKNGLEFKGCHPFRRTSGIIMKRNRNDFYLLKRLDTHTPPLNDHLETGLSSYRDPHSYSLLSSGLGEHPEKAIRGRTDPVAAHTKGGVTEQDGTAFQKRPICRGTDAADPRLQDPRSNPNALRYDARFDPRSPEYDPRYNPEYDPRN